MIKENQKKETKLLEHRFIELSRIAFEREIVTYSDFLNLNDQNILHTLPKNKLYSRYVLFGGYDIVFCCLVEVVYEKNLAVSAQQPGVPVCLL